MPGEFLFPARSLNSAKREAEENSANIRAPGPFTAEELRSSFISEWQMNSENFPVSRRLSLFSSVLFLVKTAKELLLFPIKLRTNKITEVKIRDFFRKKRGIPLKIKKYPVIYGMLIV